MNVNVVGDAVSGELCGERLEVRLAAALVTDVGNSDSGVHAEEDRVVCEVVSEGLDSKKCGEEFQGVDVMVLVDCPEWREWRVSVTV